MITFYVLLLITFLLGFTVRGWVSNDKLNDSKKNLTNKLEKFKKPTGKVFSPLKKKAKEDFFKL